MATKTLIDYHVHTSFSEDAEASPAECARAAARRGLGGIIFTEHLEFPAPPGWPEPAYTPSRLLDMARFRRTVTNLAEIWRGKLAIGCGAELGLEAHNLLGVERFRQEEAPRFDLVLGSLHAIGGTLVQLHAYTDPIGPARAASLYFERLVEGVRRAAATKACDVIGHLDLPKRSPSFGSFRLAEHREEVEAVLRLVIAGGMGIECNTSGYRQSPGEPYPGLEVLKLYRELGGEIVTVGSDSHSAETVGQGSDRALDLLRAAGFRYVTLFSHRKPTFEPI